ncbi:hypothetical protein CA54_03950 [Symmachiella macrocystis]|uniref:Uncharacterized protein n=1 Tax=Symmachiella macrocystis TaxID=2527985 RepID=A0A5C6BHR0_9PLAN|nr:hypothetical protein CA54_03950 [Symmachiella macrocystis]
MRKNICSPPYPHASFLFQQPKRESESGLHSQQSKDIRRFDRRLVTFVISRYRAEGKVLTSHTPQRCQATA